MASGTAVRTSVVSAVQGWTAALTLARSAKTVALYAGVLRAFLACHPRRSLRSIEQADIVGFLSNYDEPATKQTYFHALHSAFSHFTERGYIRSDPTVGIRLPSVKPRPPRALTESEMERLVLAAQAEGNERAWAILFLYYTGARIGEACMLRWEDVEAGQLRIRHGKGNKDRVVPVSEHLERALGALRSCSTDGRIMPADIPKVTKWVKQAAKDAGLEGVHPHTLRATAATTMLRRGATPVAVQRILGHANLNTTMTYYYAWAEEDSQKAARLL